MKNITKFVLLGLMTIPLVSFASIDTDVFYSSRGQEVIELQEYLIANGYMTGEATGNFFSITKKAAIAFQRDKGLPQTGYVGPMTRGVINKDLNEDLVGAASAEGAGSAVPVQQSETDLLKQQNALLQQQVEQQRQANISLQGVVENTTKTPVVNETPKTFDFTLSYEFVSPETRESLTEMIWSSDHNFDSATIYIYRGSETKSMGPYYWSKNDGLTRKMGWTDIVKGNDDNYTWKVVGRKTGFPDVIKTGSFEIK